MLLHSMQKFRVIPFLLPISDASDCNCYRLYENKPVENAFKRVYLALDIPIQIV